MQHIQSNHTSDKQAARCNVTLTWLSVIITRLNRRVAIGGYLAVGPIVGADNFNSMVLIVYTLPGAAIRIVAEGHGEHNQPTANPVRVGQGQ